MPKGSRFSGERGSSACSSTNIEGPCEAQFTGEEQADRAGAGDHDIIDQDNFLSSRGAVEYRNSRTTRLRTEFSFFVRV
jgi:hypothetical protein